jgi:hypothetical protein
MPARIDPNFYAHIGSDYRSKATKGDGVSVESATRALPGPECAIGLAEAAMGANDGLPPTVLGGGSDNPRFAVHPPIENQQARQLVDPLWSDRDLASFLRMSGSWVRKQRMLRRAGEPHVLTVDPIMVGSSPRYRVSAIAAWLEAQAAAIQPTARKRDR